MEKTGQKRCEFANLEILQPPAAAAAGSGGGFAGPYHPRPIGGE
jgi:hypothetical protein